MEPVVRFLSALVFFVAVLVTSNVFCALRGSKMTEGGVVSDASDVTWAHAVNSRDSLEKALAGPIDFLEADVSLGHVVGNEQTVPVPVMAHPPETTSDISLETWLNTVVTNRPEKGIKLDFKSIDVLEPSLIMLQKYSSKLKGSLWLSADVLPGPVHPKAAPLQSDYFLALCRRYLPRATLSLGWTTYWIKRFPINTWQYEWKHVRQMADTVRCWYKDDKSSPSITFSVRGIFASRSIKQLQWLLNTVPRSSLTVWTAIGDSVDAEDFLRIQESFPVEKVYYDVPDTLYKSASKFKGISARKKTFASDNDKWVSVTRNRDRSCEGFTYTDDNFILFGRPSNSAVLQKSLIPVDAYRNFSLTGRLKFFAGEHTLNPAHWEHKLNIVFGDVGILSKHTVSYSKKKLTFSVRDPETLWHAVNSSVLYTFEHRYFQDNDACRMFRLDVGSNLTFEAWTIPCDVTYEDQSYEEVTKGSISEMSLEGIFNNQERMFMVGFHSYGEEYVLVYDLSVAGQEDVITPSSDMPQLKLAYTSAEMKLKQDLTIVLIIFLTIRIYACNDWSQIFFL